MHYAMPPGPGAIQHELKPPVLQRGLPWLMQLFMFLARLNLLLLLMVFLLGIPFVSLVLFFSYFMEGTRFDVITRPAYLLFGRMVSS